MTEPTLAGTTVAITGGAGFIGSTLAHRLVDECEVVIIDDFSTGYRENVPEEAAVVERDIQNVEADDFHDAEYVFHCAANISIQKSVEDPAFDARSNVLGLLAVLDAAREAGVQRIVFSSSSAVYGSPESLPVSETEPLGPASPYAVTKRAGEQYLKLYADLYGLDTVSLRYFNVYGPRQRGDSPYAGVIAIFIERLLDNRELIIHGDGDQSRDFVYVSDIVDANLLAATEAPGDGRVYNVGTGTRHSVGDVVSLLSDVTGVEPSLSHESERDGDIRHSSANIDRIQSELGYQPQVAFEEGLERTVEWYREQLQ